MNIDPLDKIQPVEAPPFLFTRIQQRIKNNQASLLPGKVTWALSLSFLVILTINVTAVVTKSRTDHTASDLATTLHLMEENDIYR